MTERNSKLLIVDDLAANRDILTRRFAGRGFDVVEVDSGRRALEAIAAQRFDLVLLDVMMPDLDGFEVLRQIRLQHSPQALPVIMVTGRTESVEVVKAFALGANDYLAKPMDFFVALARVESQVGRKRAEEAAREAAEALRHAEEGLAQRVAARTAELVAINEQLTREIAQRQRSEVKAEYVARHDVLTGLGNRLLLRERLDQALARAHRHNELVAVFSLNLSHFTRVNQSFSHTVGDELLRAVAARLREGFRETEVIARLGSDEFVLVQHALSGPEDAGAMAERLTAVIGEPYEIGGHQVAIGTSVGISIAPNDGHEADEMLRNANLALQRAKEDGPGSQRFFEPGMDQRSREIRTFALDLHQALGEGQFDLHYQPVVSADNCGVSGFEALLRWYHPQRGLLAPAQFIPVAESNGLIGPIGEWVLKRACADAIHWPSGTKVAVNLSPAQFKNPCLFDTVASALDASGLPSSRLELEITESVLLQESETTLATLHRLREFGVRISLDDFGTGYLSLSYLRSFPFDTIKIDQSLVRELSQRADCAAIVRAITALGESLGMTTTAEGVETFEQLKQLREMGCRELQGYLFGLPQMASAVRIWLRTFAPRGEQAIAQTASPDSRAVA
jgi:diguanylate cyclase (GGDEF)-like protein